MEHVRSSLNDESVDIQGIVWSPFLHCSTRLIKGPFQSSSCSAWGHDWQFRSLVQFSALPHKTKQAKQKDWFNSKRVLHRGVTAVPAHTCQVGTLRTKASQNRTLQSPESDARSGECPACAQLWVQFLAPKQYKNIFNLIFFYQLLTPILS